MNKEDEISWYHGTITRSEAEELLLKDENTDGSFLVRKSATSDGDFVLSVLNNNDVAHFQIRRHIGDAFFSIVENTKIHGLESLIEFYQECPTGIDGVKLTVPIKGQLPPHDTRRHGQTNLLHRATIHGNDKVVLALLTSGYRHEAKNENGQTAVHLASIKGHNDILRRLIEYGANVNSRDSAAFTSLHYACRNNLVSTVNVLIREGQADFQARNTENGWVPLHEAAYAGHKKVIQELLILNAPAKPRTNKNELPVDLARANGHEDCVNILENYKAPTPKTSKTLWYHGTMDRQEAESCIKTVGAQNGSFLVRYSIRNKEPVITLYTEGSFFNFIVKIQDNNYFIDDGPLLDSLEHVIEYYSTMQDGLPTILLHPVPPRPKPPVPECKTIPRQKKKHANYTRSKISPSTSNLNPNGDVYIPSPFRNIQFSSTIELSALNNNNYTTTHDNIDSDKLKLIDTLGIGEFGSVYRGTYTPRVGEEINVAVKTLHEDQIEMNRESFQREAKVMLQLNHHCIVKLIGLSLGPPLMMVQELLPIGSMLDYLINKRNHLKPDQDFVIWAAQIACGMRYLEQQRFVHRDLAARNILLASVYQVKISDFGLSRAIGIGSEYYRARVGGKWPLKWYAPESVHYGTFSHKSDVWSFGVTLWEMFSFGEHPYGDRKGPEVIEAIMQGERLEKPEYCPDHIYAKMRSCWSHNAEDRPTFDDLFHFFSNDTDYINIKELIEDPTLV